MSIARYLLLTLMTLGMQVPSGLAIHLCFCEGLFGGVCSQSQAGETIDEEACCDDRPDEKPARSTACTESEACRCVFLSMPEQPVSKLLPSWEPSFAAPPKRTIGWVACVPDPSVQRCEPALAAAHDSPWERAVVPLRI